VQLVTANPGILTKDLKEKLTGGTDYKEKAYKYCVQQGKIIAKQVGTTSLKQHYEPSHPSAFDEKLA
jgi:hypothetical protein